ncbi:hypothetical protein [Geobacillus kaustophilus]|jgi:hypothetical protein|uniref:hypothetical protein n=1 Tax=Geobacillus kaustophilus TaxID=1462 RepID=UPI000A6667D0|nr:hypothetical protein [Geobacillus kaustophilus]
MKLDLNNINQQLIIAGLTGLVSDDGLTPHEAFALLDEIKQQTFHALVQIKQEGDKK